MEGSMHGKFIVMLMGVPANTEFSHFVPCPFIEGEQGVRVFDTYPEANEFKAKCKASYPLYWYAIAKVNVPKDQRT